MKRLADQTLYEILEVPPDAPADAIRVAYEKARTVYGPGSIVTYTLMEPDEAALLEARIEDARATLLDPERRARYDEGLLVREEPRAAAASGGATVSSTPPVIAAAPPPAAVRGPEPELEPEPAPVEEEARPEILLERAVEAAGPVAAEPSPPLAAPILLEHVAIEPATTATSTSTPTPIPIPTASATASGGAADGADEGVVVPPHAVAPAPAAPAPPLPDAWTGEALRAIREARGVSVQQICERTKVTRHHIENIEADRFSALPAQVYLRGILLALARELRLDGQKVARSYIERIGGAEPAAPPPRPR